ncbi:two-component sensor histidine kinase [Bordetella genomosp. 11]|uniref:histidine kinase n=1 Tax=Bordetella genomosp. 11 TaxID=1416808 RepID=A0A261UH78_9BORD|nr:two-component sensor histidine kinase [Bordetella genomosp. 11]
MTVDIPSDRIRSNQQSPRTPRSGLLLPRGSLARYLVVRLLPAILLLVLLDLAATWVMTHKIDMTLWELEDFFLLMVVGQIILMSLFAWVVVHGVRSGLRSVNLLSEEIRQRSIDDMQPLEVAGVPAEMEPLVLHTNDLLARLDASLAAQRRFIGHAAHQLRTPLSGLRLESELMLARPLPDDVRARAERIKAVSDRMIRLGQQLLVLARADPNARPQDSFVRIDLCEWVRASGAEWIPRVRAAQFELDLIAPDTPVWVDADPLLLDELLGNLLDNALRYGTSGGRITLTVGSNPPCLTVMDDGPGIPAEDQDRVFEAFYRSPAATAGGSGLGLAIVREIAHAHGAWWKLSSRPEFPGTRLTVVFPGPRKGAQLTRHDIQV